MAGERFVFPKDKARKAAPRDSNQCFAGIGCVAWSSLNSLLRRQPPQADTSFGSSHAREGTSRAGAIGLPPLEDAMAKTSRCAVFRRLVVVTLRLLPVSCLCGCDVFCCCGGPRCLRGNSRRMRKSLEKLGPTYVKLGQMAASREDIIAADAIVELKHLCDQVPPFPREEAQRLVCRELGPAAPTLPERSVAAASLGQVYRITGTDGEVYALKVQRPGLTEAVAVDLVILRGVAKCARRVVGCFMSASLDPVQVLGAWSATMWQELDYVREARNQEKFREALSKVNGLVIPSVIWLRTSARVLSTCWVDGHSVTSNPQSVQNRHIIIGVEIYATMVLDMGLVHADPHAGNLLVTPNNDICLLDFGMVVEVPEEHRMMWARAIVNLMRRNHDAVFDNLIAIGFFPPSAPREAMLPTMSKIWDELINSGSDVKKRKLAVQNCYEELKTMVRHFDWDLPDYYVALLRAMLTLEGIALSADIEFDIFKAAFPVALRYVTAQAAQKSKDALKTASGSIVFRRAILASCAILAAGAAVASVQRGAL